MFMNITFTELIKKVLEEQFLPIIIAPNVDQYLDLDIKNRVSIDDLQYKL